MKIALKIVAVIVSVAIAFAAGYLVLILGEGPNITITGLKHAENKKEENTNKDDVAVNGDVVNEEEPLTDAGETPSEESVVAEDSTKPSSESNTNKGSESGSFSKAEIIKIYNDAANKIKSEGPGYTKKHVQTIAEENVKAIYGNILGSLILGGFEADDETTVKKGDLEAIRNTEGKSYPARGYEWASKITVNDVKDATIKKNGNNYEVYIKILDEADPTVGDTSHFGRCMSPIEAKEALADVELVAKGLNLSISKMNYYNGYIKATIDSTTGRMISSEISATCDTYGAGKGEDLYVKGVKSTETFTDFKW